MPNPKVASLPRRKSESVNLTEIKVRNAKPRAQRYTIADVNTPGLYLRVQPTGAKSYVVRARVGGGRGARQRWATLGQVEKLRLAEARTKAKALLGGMAEGVDPRLAKLGGTTIEETLGRYERDLVDRGIVKRGEVMSSLRTNLRPLLRVPVGELGRPAIVGILRVMQERGRPGAAAYFRKSITGWLNFLVNEGDIAANPMAGFRDQRASRDHRLAVQSKRVAYRIDEMKAVWDALGRAQSPVFADLLKVTLLLGLRRSEVAHARWDWLHDDRLEIPGSHRKTGEAHAAYLGPLSTQILHRQVHLADSDLIFPGRGGRTISGWTQRLRPVVKALPGFAMHSLRRSFRTGLRELGVDVDLAELMVGHARPGLLGTYDRSKMVEMRKAAQVRWEEAVAEEVGL